MNGDESLLCWALNFSTLLYPVYSTKLSSNSKLFVMLLFKTHNKDQEGALIPVDSLE